VRTQEISKPAISGQVKLAATEAFGTFWIVPRLTEFQRAYPQLVVDFQCAMHPADVLRLDAEAAIQVTQPKSPDLKVVKLGRIHSMLSAAPSYLATYGTPTCFDDLKNHRLALQFAEQIPMREVYDQLWPGVPESGFVAFRTNNSSALLWAIIKGVGIGWSPTYMHAMKPKMVPLDIDRIYSFDVWLTYHPDAARAPKVRLLVDWVIESFNPRKYPWFRDEFIHPRDLPKHYKGPPLVNLFEGLVGG
jgi:DNA-binding transcriptional LysR family regulator